ncbi:hypothetical protein BH11MYX1_BH11MYX1_23560 [soil metagenome]
MINLAVRKATTFRGSASNPFVTKLGLACVALAACTASSDQVRPPETQLFFPTGIGVSPDESKLFVTNANSELRYDSGSINVMDLALVDSVAAEWTVGKNAPSGCHQDTDFTETLICDEAQFMLPNSGARIGNFATQLAVQDTSSAGAGNIRLIVPTRGDPSVTWVDWDGSKLTCNSDDQGFELCDDTHRLSYVHNDPDVAYLPEEPFDVFVDSPGEFAVVTHLSSGYVTLINTPAVSNASIADVAVGIFAASPLTGLQGATGVTGHVTPSGLDTVYVGSRTESRIQMFTVGRPPNQVDPYLITGNFFFLDSVGGNIGGSSDTRGMKFSADGKKMYLINRDPPSLQVVDTSLGETGFPRNKVIAATDICRQASTLTALDSGDGEKVYLTCFSTGSMYIVDPSGQSSVADIVTVGRGPYAIAASAVHKKIYVTNFLEDTISVIDVAPGSPTRNRVVLRIGEVKPP